MMSGVVTKLVGPWAAVRVGDRTFQAYVGARRQSTTYEVAVGNQVLIAPATMGHLVLWVVPSA